MQPDQNSSHPKLTSEADKDAGQPASPLSGEEITSLPADFRGRLFKQAMHAEDQGKLEPIIGTSLGKAAARNVRMEQVAARDAGDVEVIKFLERQDDAFRLENITLRQNPDEMLYELQNIILSGQQLRIDASAWFAAECVLRQPTEDVCEAAIEVLQAASTLSAGAVKRVQRAVPLVHDALAETRPDLAKSFDAVR